MAGEIEIYSGDIRDYDFVYESMKWIDYVFHLAALICIPYFYYFPLVYIKTNVARIRLLIQVINGGGMEAVMSESEVIYNYMLISFK